MAIASPSAPGFCPTARSGSQSSHVSQPISTRPRINCQPWGLRRTAIAAQLNTSSDGELLHELSYERRRRGSFPVYVTLPIDAVGPTAQTMRRSKTMAQSFRALAAAGVEGVVMEVWWGLVERDFPGFYDWRGYLEVVLMAKRFGLKVRAVMAFHQCGSGPDDPFCIPLPRWVLEEINKNPDVTYADRFGRRSLEYISLGCDIIPILQGRSPIQAYRDFMRNFRDSFRSFLGGIITGIQVGLGPGGELRYPSCPSQKLTWAWRSRELGEFHCYDKYMLASLNACAHEIGMHEWANGGPIGASNLMQNPENTEFFKTNGSWKTPYGEFFLGWYSEMLLLHGERICREAELVFQGNEVNLSGKVAGIHWHYGTQSHPSELTSGYYNTSLRDGFIPIARMFSRYGFAMSCSCFDIQDLEEKQIHPLSSPEGFLKQLLLAAKVCDVPVEGENSATSLDDDSFGQILKMLKFYSNGLQTPSFSFNFVRMDKSLFEFRNWISFTRFVKQMSVAGIFRANLGFGGGNTLLYSSPAATFTGAVVAH